MALVDVKEAVEAAAPRAPGVAMPRANAVRVVAGAKALSPHLGERMVVGPIAGRAVVLRELALQDLKLELTCTKPARAAAMARYLGCVVGQAHGRQLDHTERAAWRKTVMKWRSERMLAFARKQELKLEAVDIPHLVRGMSEFIRRSIGPNVDVQMRFAEVLPRAQTDPYQLETALLNLVVNARDALPNGGEIAITADQVSVSKTEGERRAGSFVRLSVSDNGTGMPAEIAAKVTEPFFTTKGVGKGTGLGLSMVQGLAGQSGGWIEIHSEVGKGTRIDLWLPLATAEFPTAGSPVTEAIQETCKRLVVLAVDDDPLVLTNTVAMLDELGHNVLAANSGDEAMVIFQRHPEIDLVLTDEVMPGLSGSQLAERVRELRPTAAVALVSGYADLHPTPGRGLADLPRLAKPFTLAQLVGFIDELALDSHHAAH